MYIYRKHNTDAMINEKIIFVTVLGLFFISQRQRDK